MRNAKGSLMLLLTAFIWGTAFVAQSVGMEHIAPFTFNCIRNFLGAVALLPVIFVMSKLSPREKKEDNRTLVIGGVCCGIALAVASSLQQIGIQYTTSGKSGFITALYIIFVPVFALFTRNKPKPVIWISVALGIAGMYLLCVKESLSVNKGDVYIFLCAVAFAFHIMIIDHFSPKVDGVKMSCIQFLVCGSICLVCTLLVEEPTLDAIRLSALPLIYTGIMSSGVAYTLQIVGQKYTSASLATLIMSLESVFAALAGWVMLNEGMSATEIFGSVLMFIGILIAQFI